MVIYFAFIYTLHSYSIILRETLPNVQLLKQLLFRVKYLFIHSAKVILFLSYNTFFSFHWLSNIHILHSEYEKVILNVKTGKQVTIYDAFYDSVFWQNQF